MEHKRSLVVVAILAVALVLTGNASLAGPSAQEPEAPADVHVAGTVASKITYQGRLTDDRGNPLNGSYDLTFQLFEQPSGGSGWGPIVRNNVQVTDGLFTVDLNIIPSEVHWLDGRGLWLEISVRGQPLSPRQELLPVPYAMSLRPGATIKANLNDGVINVYNEGGFEALRAYSHGGAAVFGRSGPTIGSGTLSTGRFGVQGYSFEGVGVFGEGGHTGTYGSGTNHGVKGESYSGDGVFGLVTSSSGGAGVRGRNDGGGAAIVSDGDLVVTGAYRGNIGPNNGAPFPRPAYDSAWVTINPGQSKTFTHNLGGNVDNYVVDLQFRDYGPLDIHGIGYGGDMQGSSPRGGYYRDLTSSTVGIHRQQGDTSALEMRVRIWVYR